MFNDGHLPQNRAADILRRDGIRIKLRQLCQRNPQEARSAGERLHTRINALLAAKKKEAQRAIEERLLLLPVARRLALDVINGTDGMQCRVTVPAPAPGMPAPQLEGSVPSDGRVPMWVSDIATAIGRYDLETRREIENLTGHLLNAARGRIGDFEIDERFDLQNGDAIGAYVFAITKLWSKGEQSEDAVRESLNPERARNPLLGVGWAAWQLLRETTGGDTSQPHSRDGWWEIAILTRIADDPDLDGTTLGLPNLPPWRCDPGPGLYWDGRESLLDDLDEPARTEESTRYKLLLLAERALLHLGEPHLAQPPTARKLNDSEQAIVDTLTRAGHRLTTEPLLKRALGKTTSQGKSLLARLVQLRVLTNHRDTDPPGYGLAEWG